MFAPTRSPSSTLAALLALLAIALRLLLPALHTHPEVAVAVTSTAASHSLLGGCRCDTFTIAAAATDADLGDAVPVAHDAAPAAVDHGCFACDFELAHPPLAPAPAAPPAAVASHQRAPPAAVRAPAAAQRWARPPSRAPPRTPTRA